MRDWSEARVSDRERGSDPSLLFAASRYCTEVHDEIQDGKAVSSFSLTCTRGETLLNRRVICGLCCVCLVANSKEMNVWKVDGIEDSSLQFKEFPTSALRTASPSSEAISGSAVSPCFLCWDSSV